MLREEGPGSDQEAGRGRPTPIGEDLGEGQARGVIDGDMDHLVAAAAGSDRRTAAVHAVAPAGGHARQRLHIEVEEFSRMLNAHGDPLGSTVINGSDESWRSP
jgi:hypothetical protein